MNAEEIVKVCGCGASYTHREWLALPECGVQDTGSEDEDDIALRNCSCGSTIALDRERLRSPLSGTQPCAKGSDSK